jgi:TRAP-type mannitol/chloroaromatic compound transport system substrate-binding protein
LNQPLGWFKEAPQTADDMRGLKYRTVGLAADVMQAMGLAVAQLPGGEILPAMERGVIDAFEFNNPTSDRRFGAQDVAKNYMMGSYHQATEYFEIIFNKTKFDELPGEHKAIIEHAAEAASTANMALAYDNYSSDLQWLRSAGGVQLNRTSPSILEAQLQAWDEVMGRLQEDAFIKKIADSQRAWAQRVVFYELYNNADYRLAYEHYFGKLDI